MINDKLIFFSQIVRTVLSTRSDNLTVDFHFLKEDSNFGK